MKQQVAVGIVAAALVVGSGTGLVVRAVRSDATPVASSPTTSASTPTSSPTPTAPTAEPSTPASSSSQTPKPPPAALLSVGEMQINTGAVGPVSVGMTKQQAAATGYFEVDVPSEVCEGSTPLAWKSNYVNALDVLVDQNATIATIGIRGLGPKTRSGLGISSSYSEVRKVLGSASEPESAGYGQTGLFVNDGNAWIGFLFDVPPQDIEDGDAVTFVEVTRGRKPSLMRDGC